MAGSDLGGASGWGERVEVPERLACSALLVILLVASSPSRNSEDEPRWETGPVPGAEVGSFFLENAGQISEGNIRYYSALGGMQVGFGRGFVLLRLLDHGHEALQDDRFSRPLSQNLRPPSPRSA